ncbi:MAG TPA: YSC84-related protein [Thermodesulfovibrionales bacterium]|jgi:lipid-binding SYLF domain-containing protein|nr:YSC84-related protein [Thermodesulfovibrionales bacterium]
MKYFHLTAVVLTLLVTCTFVCPAPVAAASAAEINRDVKSALDKLYAKSATARALGEKAKGILVFPGIVKGGFIVGGQYGEGALIEGGKIAGYYNTVQASYGLQAGIQKFGYALFFMTDSALKWIDKSDGWELGVGPTIVVVDIGAAKSMSTTTLQSEIYAMFFDQKGLMAGLGLQGTKITRIEK